MAVITMKELLESGVQFGHQTRRWDPRMAPYIFTNRNGIHILDLQKTMKQIESSYVEMKRISQEGGDVLFVGTKKQAQKAIKEAAEKSGSYYVNQRWLGGMLTNFQTISKRVKRLKDLEEMFETGTISQYPKKEQILLSKEKDKLEKFLSGIKDMKGLPKAIFVVDPSNEVIAIQEARKLGIPVFAMVDTNCNPNVVDHIIASNDDAIRAIALITDKMADAILEGRSGEVEVKEEAVESKTEKAE